MLRCLRLIAIALLLSLALWRGQPLAFAGTTYEERLGGFIHSSIQALVTGEFAGRRPSQVDVAGPWLVCRPSDYDDLRAAANDQAAFDAFRRRCRFVEVTRDDVYVHGTVYLPVGHCQILKNAFETMLAERVYAASRDTNELAFEYKGSRYLATSLTLARGARLEATCREDGSLRVSAPRKRKAPNDSRSLR